MMRKSLPIALVGALLFAMACSRPAAAVGPGDAKLGGVVSRVSYTRLTGPAKPLGVVCVASYDDLIQALNQFGRLMDRPEMGKMAEGLVAMLTQGKGLAGFDTTRPCGVCFPADSVFAKSADLQQLASYACVPITDLTSFLGMFEPFATVEPGSGGVYRILSKNSADLHYVKAVGSWAFASSRLELLSHVSNPTPWFAELPKEYLVAGRWFAADMPTALHAKLLAQVDEAQEKSRQRKPAERDDQFALRVSVQDLFFQAFKQLLNDLDQVTCGLALEPKSNTTCLDLTAAVRVGSPTAAQIALLDKAESRFLKFQLPGAAVVAHWAGAPPPLKADDLLAVIHLLRDASLKEAQRTEPPATLKQTKDLIQQLTRIVEDTIKAGPCDGTISLRLEPKAVTLLAANRVADATDLDKALHTILELAIKKDPKLAGRVKLDVDHVGPVRLHQFTLPVAADKNKELASMFGDEVQVFVGIGADAVYLAAGRDALAALRRAITAADNTARRTTPLEMSIAMGPMMRFSAAVDPHNQSSALPLVAEFGKTPDQENVRYILRPVAQGLQFRIEIEPGVMRAFGRAATKAAGVARRAATPAPHQKGKQ